MTTPQFPVVRPSQRIRNVARAIDLEGRREGIYPTNADILEEIAAAVAENEERQADQAARIAKLEKENGELEQYIAWANGRITELENEVRS
jgi:hypothetical protein